MSTQTGGSVPLNDGLEKDSELYQRIFGNLHRCNACKYFTKSTFEIQNHLKRHKIKGKKFNCEENPPEKYFCNECKFSTHLKAHLKQHIRYCLGKQNETELDLRTHTCEKCPFWTNSYLVLLEHQSKKCKNVAQNKSFVIEDGVKWYLCRHCNHKTKQKVRLKNHVINKHTPFNRIPWFICRYCGYKAKNKIALVRHMAILHQSVSHVKWHHCDHCEYKTNDLFCLKKHIYHKHTQNVDVKLYHCHFCNHKTPVPAALKRHMFTKHSYNLGVKLHQCDQCEYKTTHLGQLKQHKITKHKSDIDCFQCDFCDYKTGYSSSLKLHLQRKHSSDNIKWLQCDQLEYKAKINKHATDKKNFHCDHCEHRSTTKQNLQEHVLRKHTEEKNIKWFVCYHCEHKYKTKRDLAQHLATHSVTKFECDRCDYKCKSKAELNRHSVKKHVK